MYNYSFIMKSFLKIFGIKQKLILGFILFLITIKVSATNYYVNASSSAGGVLTTGGGKDASGYGTLINKPTQTLSYLLSNYTPNDGDSIIVDKGTYNSANDHNFTFSKAVIIKGAGNGNNGGNCTDFKDNINDHYFANITAGVTLLNMKIENYGSDGSLINGQAIHIALTKTATVTMNKVIFYNNSYGSGGFYATVCIENSNASYTTTVNMTGTSFQCNGTSGGAEGGGIDVIGSNAINLTCTNCSFIYGYKSEFSKLEGAALAITNSNASVTLNNCRISYCKFDLTSDTHGGGSIYQSAGTLNINNSIIENSTLTPPAESELKGSAIYIGGGSLSISGTLIQNNSNTSSIYGTIGIVGGTVTIANSKFLSNSTADGNDVYISGGTLSSMSNTTISTTTSPNKYEVYKAGGTITTISSCGGAAANYNGVTPSNYNSPSAFSTPSVPIFTGTCGSISLPIKLISFSGECLLNNAVSLHWSTAAEINNNYFTIEKSTDANNWEVLAKVPGAGNSNSLLNYSVTDEEINNVLHYYRLKQTDFNGDYTYSEIIAVKSCFENNFDIIVAGNPVVNTMNLIVNSTNKGGALFFVKDVLGRNLITKEVDINNGENSIYVNVNYLRNGIYFIVMEPKSGGKPIVKEIVINN